jgi:PhoH-like ATPase
MTAKKLFVLDTNVILHDHSCLFQFADNDVVIPITVLEELDNFKKGNEDIHYHAREFVRIIDGLSGDKLFGEGIKIRKDLGKLMVQLNPTFHPDLTHSFASDKPDHQILNVAYTLHLVHRSRKVTLVTKDVNLRLKAKALGISSQDYYTDKVKDIETLYKGKRLIAEAPANLVERIFEDGAVDASLLEPETPFKPNEFVILRGPKRSVLASYHAPDNRLKRVEKQTAYGIRPRNSEQAFALSALTDPNIQLVTISGKAGTGKTLLALAASLEMNAGYQSIFLARPIVPLSNKDIGFLPGDIKSKLDPYMQPLFDNLSVIQGQYAKGSPENELIAAMVHDEKLKISALSYIRGRSLVKTFFIIDEAQNLTPHEVKTIITRAGEGTKVVFTGDIFQIDHPYLDAQSNGMSYLIERMQGQDIYAHITLEKGERSALAELASNLL